ncbi:MAG: hypothetical protein MUF05_04920 [Candidatus Omnitrophica bacterium]|jgi:hypothetical protein|nr:hypothetical protein [Candidatus Omnitrophota bacterium]
MADKKKKWAVPQLIVLTRGRAEERVLLVCKNPPSSYGMADGSCKKGGVYFCSEDGSS